MNKRIMQAAKAVADQFDEVLIERGEIHDSFIDPGSRKKVQNAVTIHVTKLRELSAAVKEDTPSMELTQREADLLGHMVADRLANIRSYLRGLESSASYESEKKRKASRIAELTNLQEKLRPMRG